MATHKQCPFKNSFDSIYSEGGFKTPVDNLGNLGCSVSDCKFNQLNEDERGECGINAAYVNLRAIKNQLDALEQKLKDKNII